ncbi:glycosyltransferase family 4 protein [Acinetobacter boissieri]|uniref:Glycosyltransferase involved in cell wall bisynthesis n=1 Tax=Acinetobacter boissieri TaxID=1219383 RepID=A0A1G6HIN9_9GAMM|nr:glycosyltransferase family 4 protein [Acinetobacter boissieri]SDB94120.1 Glycosyltransferase involved in cell wall bisynthesis [Acinetobacter boissieri]
MKVFHVAETIKGGVATVMNQLIEAQLANGYTIRTLTPSDQLDQLFFHDDMQSFIRDKRGIIGLLNLWFQFIYHFITYKPDVLHIHSSFAGLICRITLMLLFPFSKCNIIYCPHSFSFLMDTSPIKKRFFILIERILTLKTTFIICVSKNEIEEAASYGFNERKLKLIYNGIDQNINLKAKKYLNEEKLNLLFIGRFDYQKGYDKLVNLIERLLKNNIKNFNINIVGDVVNGSDFIQLEYENVKYSKWLNKEKLATYYLNSDIILMPSRWEGLPMVAIEALSLGVPIISKKVSSFPEIIDEGENGFMFNNDEDFYNKVKFAIEFLTIEDLKILSANAYDKYMNTFTAKNMIDLTNDLYTKN